MGALPDMTIGVGLVCAAGKCVILASDMRGSYGDLDKDPTAVIPNDKTGKQFDFHPMKLVCSVAGRLTVAHNLVSQLTIELDKVVDLQEKGESIRREHLENAVNEARIHEMHRIYEYAARINYDVTVQQLLQGKLRHGKLNPIAWKEICKFVFETPLPAELILAGFVEDEPILLKASGKKLLEGDADPPICVIGSKGARFALEHLNKRGQHIFSGFAQSLLHVHEALDIARREDKFVGPCPAYVVMLQGHSGIAQMPHDAPCLKQWAIDYAARPSTDTLNNDICKTQAEYALVTTPLSPRFRQHRHRSKQSNAQT